MSGYQVIIDAIRSTGRAATRVADGLRAIDCAATLPEGDGGMPGSRAAGKLEALRRAWHGRETGFTSLLDEHAAAMHKAARHYASSDDAAAQDMTPSQPPAGGPRPV